MNDTDPRIPSHLLRFRPTDWNHLPPLGDMERRSDSMRDLRLREHWRQAQDDWCRSAGLDRAAFENLAKWQSLEQPPAASPADLGDTPGGAQ